MKLWQNLMIRLATSGVLKKTMQESRASSFLASRFVGGRTITKAFEREAELTGEGMAVSHYFLGEYIDDEDLLGKNQEAVLGIIETAHGNAKSLHLSIDPTQIGYGFDDQRGELNGIAIAKVFRQLPKERQIALMIDMEDSSFVDRTLKLRKALVDQDIPIAQTLQAYLGRTRGDLEALLPEGGWVRLVKGAFVGSPDVSFTSRQAIDRNYLELAERMLSADAKTAKFYPAFGTHDEKMIGPIEEMIKAKGWEPTQYEFEMLYGVRSELQKELVARGHRVRLYLPHGEDWWPYAVRRVGESPRNARLLARALFG